MKKSIEKDKKKRVLFLEHEAFRKVLKTITKNSNLPNNLREKAKIELSSLPKNSSIVRLRQRCLITGRGRSIVGGFNLSRLMVRKLGGDGMLHSVRKSS